MITSNKIVTWNDFHNGTCAIFTRCERPEREPDFTSESGSVYWDTGEGVIRGSDHWSNSGNWIRSCHWQIASRDKGFIYGFCPYAEFYRRKVTQTTVPAGSVKFDGGPVAASSFVRGRGRYVKKLPVPAWAEECLAKSVRNNPSWYPVAVRDFLLKNPKVQKIIWAHPKHVKQLQSGAKLIKFFDPNGRRSLQYGKLRKSDFVKIENKFKSLN